MIDNIPAHAVRHRYFAGNGKRGEYFVWQSKSKWVWSALGNTAEVASEEDAMSAARLWIAKTKEK